MRVKHVLQALPEMAHRPPVREMLVLRLAIGRLETLKSKQLWPAISCCPKAVANIIAERGIELSW